MHGIHVRKGSWAVRPGIWQVWQQLLSSLSLQVRHLKPDQVPPAGLSWNTLQYSVFHKVCSKSSVCGLLSPAPVVPVLSYVAEFLYFIQEMEIGESELQLFAALNYFWDEWASVFFCNCMYPISLLKLFNFHSVKYICLYELYRVKYRMFFLPRKVKQWVHQNISPFPHPKKNQQPRKEITKLERDLSPLQLCEEQSCS